MELLKRNIHMNRRKSRAVSQLTLDDDYNVPDMKADIGRIIQSKGTIKVEDVQVSADHVLISGNLVIRVLYICDGGTQTVYSLEGSIPFEDNVNLDGVVNGDNIRLKWEIEDLSVSIINSRKLNMKAIVTFRVTVEEAYDAQTAVDVECMEEVSKKNREMDVLQTSLNKKDTYRVRDEINLASNKPNIHEILWESVQLRSLDMRLGDGKLDIKGELFIFVLYSGEDDNSTMQWIESALPFSGEIDCPGAFQDMVANIDVEIMNYILEVRPDYDGEERMIQIDAVIELDMRLYEETRIELLQDLYMPSKDIVPVKEPVEYERLLIKNSSKCRINERTNIDSGQEKILQICHCEGEVNMDEVAMVDNGLKVEGVIKAQILYITADDKMPFYSMEAVVPFEHTIEVPGINEEVTYYLQPSIEQLSATMADSDEVEIKSVITLEVLVIQKSREDVITDVVIQELDMKKMQEMPGMVGYVVQPHDTLWDIAKRFYTTTDYICRTNGIEEQQVRAGDRLIVMKSMDHILS